MHRDFLAEPEAGLCKKAQPGLRTDGMLNAGAWGRLLTG